MRKKDKRRVIGIIKNIRNKICKEGLYDCCVAEIYDKNLRRRTKPSIIWYDEIQNNDIILALRFLRSKYNYNIEVAPYWASSPSYFKGILFFRNSTNLIINEGIH
jgi:hypothetical protein